MAGGGQAPKKDLMYKIKAFKRRTVHAVAKASGKAEQTQDPEFDDLFFRFEVTDRKFSCLYKSMNAYAQAQQEVLRAGMELSEAFLDLYEGETASTAKLRSLVTELESVNTSMATDVSPQLANSWAEHVEEPVRNIAQSLKDIRDDADRRKRYMADYDHYRSKKDNMEKADTREKNPEKVKENEKKLADASNKYFSINAQLSERLKLLDNHKNAMLNEPLLAAIAVQHDFFSQSSRFEPIYAHSKQSECMDAVLREAEALIKAESRVQNMKSVTRSPSSFSRSSTLSIDAKRASFSAVSFETSPSTPQQATFQSQIDGLFTAPEAKSARAAPLTHGGSGNKRVRALFAYQAAAEIEMDLQEGDVITVLKEDDSGWWQGEVNGRIGWFPFTYTELVR